MTIDTLENLYKNEEFLLYWSNEKEQFIVDRVEEILTITESLENAAMFLCEASKNVLKYEIEDYKEQFLTLKEAAIMVARNSRRGIGNTVIVNPKTSIELENNLKYIYSDIMPVDWFLVTYTGASTLDKPCCYSKDNKSIWYISEAVFKKYWVLVRPGS